MFKLTGQFLGLAVSTVFTVSGALADEASINPDVCLDNGTCWHDPIEQCLFSEKVHPIEVDASTVVKGDLARAVSSQFGDEIYSCEIKELKPPVQQGQELISLRFSQ